MLCPVLWCSRPAIMQRATTPNGLLHFDGLSHVGNFLAAQQTAVAVEEEPTEEHGKAKA